MRLFSFAFIALVLSSACLAHQSNLSTSFLSTTSGGMNVLQITSSLGAFEGEIDFVYGKEAYKTPEEFRELVIQYFKENVLFIVNGQDTLRFGKPRVILGHESKLVVEVLGLPSNITSFYFKNTMFKDMHHNKMALMLSSTGFPKNQLELNNDNQHQITQRNINGTWITQEKKSDVPFYKNTLFILVIIGILFLIIVLWVMKRKKRK